MIYFKAFFFSWKGDKKPLEACCHSRTISAVCHLQDGRRGRGKRQDMDSTFIYKQGSLNRGHFIIALKFTGASKPACHPAGWPWLGSSRVCEVVGGGRILPHCPTGWKRCPGNSVLMVGKLNSWESVGFRCPRPGHPHQEPELDSRSFTLAGVHPPHPQEVAAGTQGLLSLWNQHSAPASLQTHLL